LLVANFLSILCLESLFLHFVNFFFFFFERMNLYAILLNPLSEETKMKQEARITRRASAVELPILGMATRYSNSSTAPQPMNNMPEPNTFASGQPSKSIKERQMRLRDRSALQQEPAAQPSGPEKTIRKRKFSGRVKRACENCKKGKRCCDENRPCARCVRLGLEKTCRDAKRKNSKEEEPKDSNAGHAHNNCAGNSHEGSSEASLSPCSSPVHAHSAPSSYHASVSSGLDLYDPNYDGFAKLLASAKEIDSRNPSKESRPPATVFPSPSLTTAHHPSHFPSFAKKEKASTTRPLEMPLVPNNLESIHILLRTIMASEKI
jgi:hypothetical protein